VDVVPDGNDAIVLQVEKKAVADAAERGDDHPSAAPRKNTL
jgi:hypothetical protein